MDALDRRILLELEADARQPLATIARSLGVSAPTVAERMRRMEETGVISAIRAELEPAALGLPLRVLVRLRPIAGRLREVEALLMAEPRCLWAVGVTGEDCFVAEFALSGIDALDPLLEPFHALAETNTAVIKATAVPRRNPPLLSSS